MREEEVWLQVKVREKISDIVERLWLLDVYPHMLITQNKAGVESAVATKTTSGGLVKLRL